MSKRKSVNPIVLQHHQESVFVSCSPVTLEDGVVAHVGRLSTGTGPAAVLVQRLEFDRTRFTEEQAQAWAQSRDWAEAATSAFEHSQLRAEGQRFYGLRYSDFVAAADAGSMPEPDVKDDSESWNHVSALIVNALVEHGWYIWGEGAFDFEPKAFYEDNVVCVDIESGEYFMIPYTVVDDKAVLGTPAKTDVTYSPKDAPASGTSPTQEPTKEPVPADEPAAAAAVPAPKSETTKDRFKAFNSAVPVLVRAADSTPDGRRRRPIFKILVCHSGWSRDRRYFEREALTDAVERGVFDGVQFNIMHPERDTGERERISCAISLPGRTTWQDNRAGGVDVFCDVMFALTDDGEDMAELMRMSIEQEVPMCGTSVYGRTQSLKNVMRDGRIAEKVYTKIHQLYAIDFVDRAALARTGPVEILAAREGEHSQGTRGGATNIMTVTPEMAALQAKLDAAEKTAAEAITRAETAERASAVELLMAGCVLPITLQSPLKTQLNGIKDEAQRKAQYDLVCAGYAASLPHTKVGNPGAGGSADDKPGLDVSAAAADEIMRVAKSRGLKVEDLVAAQERRKGNVENAAANKGDED